MIDINKLRQSAQAATPGPWVSQGRYIGTPRHMSYIGEVRDQCGNWSDTEKSRADAAFIAAANPAAISELIDRLEAAEKDVALKERVIDALGSELNAVANERDALRAKIEAMEQQEPVAFALYSGVAIKAAYLKEHEACDQKDRRQLTADLGGSLEAYRVVPLYALHGAQPAPSVPDGFAWPECPKRRQSHVLFDDGYEEGWAACVATIKAAIAATEAKP